MMSADILRLLNVQFSSVASRDALYGLAHDVSEVHRSRRIARSVTDWPFEHFWSNPHEPLHSKLLGYFLDPKEHHGCGSFLLKHFLKALDLGSTFPDPDEVAEHCKISIEAGRIDLLIECFTQIGKFAVIIENKVNWAIDQDKQLQTYAMRMHALGYGYQNIYACYLPLTDQKHPESSDLQVIKKLGVEYRHRTFEKHILEWLDIVLNTDRRENQPKGMHGGMRDNLIQYRNLIKYLLNLQFRQTMDTNVTDRLREAERNGSFPSCSEVSILKDSIIDLDRCLRSVVRGKFLLRVREVLKERKTSAWFCSEDVPLVVLPVESSYDSCFAQGIDLCIEVNESIVVCLGAQPEDNDTEIFWTGCMKRGSERSIKRCSIIVTEELSRILRTNSLVTNHPWYGWAYNVEINYENCLNDAIVGRAADALTALRDGILARLA